MTTYSIHSDNLERLEKKLNTIKAKCNKYNTNFSYNVVGQEYKDVTDDEGNTYTALFYNVEVEGFLKHDGWRFAATIEHKDNINVIRAYDTELEIPERFRTCSPTCEHCNRIRSRKDTFVVYNEETQEFKQVGKTCLNEYTNGLSAEAVASYISLFDEMIKGSSYSGSGYTRYLIVEDILRYAFETVHHFGYQKKDEYDWNVRTTRSRVSNYIDVDNRNIRNSRTYESLKAEMDEVGFDANSEYAVESTKAALEWLHSEKNESRNDYIANLIAVVSAPYAESRDFGLLVSIPVAYMRHLELIEEYKQREAQHKAEEKSQFVGQEGERVTCSVNNFKCVSAWDTQFGTTFLYKWTDDEGNIFTWFASNSIEDEDTVKAITGTVKKHETYKEVNQTILTRCKVTERCSKPAEEHKPGTFNLDDLDI